jgi:hypothetical protein
MFFSKRAFNALSSSSRCSGDKSFLLLLMLRALIALIVVASRVSYLLLDYAPPHRFFLACLCVLINSQFPRRSECARQYTLARRQANMRMSHFSPPARDWQENLGRLLHKRCLLLQRKHQISVALCLALEAIRNSPAVPTPNFVLDTSPGKHQVVWKVSGFSQDEAESLLHSLANQFGGDLASTDSTRVLRLPGFANRKLPEEFIVQARQESDTVYTLRDFTIDEDSPETQRHLGDYRERGRKVASDPKSQSEHDWTYAKRALARGDDPEVVIQRIADYRAEDKDDPNYYARHTVTKAQADLHRGTATVGTHDSQRIESHQLNEDQRGMP